MTDDASFPEVINGLSVDVEDWFQVGAFEQVIERGDWDGLTTRVERNVSEILDMFEAAEVKATFFTLGWVAKRNPALIRQIAERGHEVASHGWDHARVHTMDRAQFAEDIRKARYELEDASGVAVTGYRAPSFSIDQRTPWAYLEMAEQGYAYSSSVAPIAHDQKVAQVISDYRAELHDAFARGVDAHTPDLDAAERERRVTAITSSVVAAFALARIDPAEAARGIASAHAAGLAAVVAVPTRLTAHQDLSGATAVVASLADLTLETLAALT